MSIRVGQSKGAMKVAFALIVGAAVMVLSFMLSTPANDPGGLAGPETASGGTDDTSAQDERISPIDDPIASPSSDVPSRATIEEAVIAPSTTEPTKSTGRAAAGCVEFSIEPVSGWVRTAVASVTKLPRGRDPEVQFSKADVLGESTLADDGTARVCELDLGYYLGWVNDNAGTTYSRVASVGSKHGSRARFRFGTGSLSGRVLDESQILAAGAIVRATWTDGGRQTAHAVTGKEGRYRLPRLAAGDYELTVRLAASSQDRHDYVRTVALAPEEERVEDFAPEAGFGVITGTVRNANGDPVVGSGLVPGGVKFISEAEGTEFSDELDPMGRFHSSLPEGVYEAWVTIPGYRHPVLAEKRLEVDAIGLERDLSVNGTRVSGSTFKADRVTPMDADSSSQRAAVRFYRKDRDWEWLVVSVVSDGQYQVDGLTPGVWVFSMAHDPADAGTEILVSEGDVALTLNLVASH